MRRWILASLVWGMMSSIAPAAEVADVQKLLAHTIIAPELPLQEVRAYTESRVPNMPDVKSVAEWEKLAGEYRQAMFDKVVFRGEAKKWREAKVAVEWLGEIEGGPGYKMKKLRYEALPGLWIPAVLYEPTKLDGKAAVSLAVNGHEPVGKAADYKQIRCINQAKRGTIVLNLEWLGMGQLRTEGFVHYRANQLDLCGTSAVSPFFLAMQRGLDILLAHPNADPERLAVSGLSGGGWQTIFLSSLDTRVKLANPVAGYSSFKTRAQFPSDLGDTEQTPNDMATAADYAHLTAMMAPRPTLLTFNAKDDCCFRADHALDPLLAAAAPIFKLYGKEGHLRQHVNEDPGTHNYQKENREKFYAMLKDFFASGDPNFSAREIPSDDEVKTSAQLFVELPKENLDFHKIALALSKDLPRKSESDNPEAALARLREIVRAKDYHVTAKSTGSDLGETRATYWRLRMGSEWTVPAVDLVRGEAKGAVILVGDGGRQNLAAEAERLLGEGKRVVAVDPFYFGESHISERDHLYAMLVAGVGERPLGIQASQLAAVARWLKDERQTGPVVIVAVGRRASLFALIAAALEKEAIAGVELHGAFKSLKEIIDENLTIDKAPELFCFALLEQFDIPQIEALLGARPIVRVP